MNALKEENCMKALQEICSDNFNDDEYSLNGSAESAVCLEKTTDGWMVYEKEKNSKNDTFFYDNIVEACLDFLRRLSMEKNYRALKDVFFDRIIAGEKIA
ncbi:MAG: hypothetical protein IJU93_00020 [Lachnospiraceae bacterium]|nr:hypothetical protein [Lachnospiraceae bacterium]